MTPDQMTDRAAKLRSDADAILGRQPNDYAYWTQPGGNRAFINGRERAKRKLDKAYGMIAEADKLEAEAHRIRTTPARIAAARIAREAAIATANSFKPGDRVMTQFFGAATVLRVNKRSVTVQLSNGPYRLDKEFVHPITEAA